MRQQAAARERDRQGAVRGCRRLDGQRGRFNERVMKARRYRGGGNTGAEVLDDRLDH